MSNVQCAMFSFQCKDYILAMKAWDGCVVPFGTCPPVADFANHGTHIEHRVVNIEY